jgi:hypothetical protein
MSTQDIYERLKPGDAMYEMVKYAHDHGRSWVCDSLDHNEEGGCSNPKCFKFETNTSALSPGWYGNESGGDKLV